MPDQIPPELMQAMQGGGGQPGGAPAGAGTPPPPSGPVSAPMSTPQDNAGEKHAAMSQVQMAVKLLEQTIAPFGSDSDEGKTILDVLKKLSGTFGESQDKGRALIPSEIMNLVSGMPQGAGGPPPGAGAPPGMPPGAQPQPPMQ